MSTGASPTELASTTSEPGPVPCVRATAKRSRLIRSAAVMAEHALGIARRRAPVRRSSVKGSETNAGAPGETTVSLLICGVLLLPKPLFPNSISAKTRRTSQLMSLPGYALLYGMVVLSTSPAFESHFPTVRWPGETARAHRRIRRIAEEGKPGNRLTSLQRERPDNAAPKLIAPSPASLPNDLRHRSWDDPTRILTM